MSKDIDFKSLWVKQTIDEPSMEEILLKLKRYKKQNLIKVIAANVLLLSTSVFIIYTALQNQPQWLTTKIGICLIILAMAMFLAVYNQLIPAFSKLKNTLSNNEYLQQLIVLKNKQQFLQSTMLNLYFILLSSGLCLAMYEYTTKMPVVYALLTYVLSLGWIAFNWFYTRPKSIKKQQASLNEIIGNFERINKQLGNES